MSLDLHPDLARLADLVGTWSGSGRGSYPTIEPFDYHETIVVDHVGRPFLSYSQRTRHAADGRPLHAEVGYLRTNGPDGLELMVAHPTGVVELAEGVIDGVSVRFSSTTVGCSSSAKAVIAVEREFRLIDGRLRYVLRMSAVGRPMTHHLEAELTRVAPAP